MNEIAQADQSEIVRRENAADNFHEKPIGIRVSPNDYFTALFLATFFTGFLVYIEQDLAALLLFVLSWLLFPFLAYTDRIIFDGKRLTRTGYLPTFWANINNSRYRLKIADIEQVETQSLRALKRGGNIFYRYRTVIEGKDLRFVIASGGEDYRKMIHAIIPRLSENVLDNRSIELRDYLAEPKETLMKAEFAKIPSPEVLEDSFNKKLKTTPKEIGTKEIEKSDYLRVLANELRLSGYLLQSLEAFRRALVLNPKNAWLIFEFARCLHSFGSTERDEKLKKRATAALRLAERRADGDNELLARLGETYFQFGDFSRSKRAFERAIEIFGESFRTVRGLAEIALREGKIAHVIHNFAAAYRLAETKSLRRWTQAEQEYFSRLNTDEDYMDLEISRINSLENMENHKKASLKIALLGLPAILFGVVLDEHLIANLGWAISAVALLIWIGMIITQKLLSTRIPLDLQEED